VYTGFWRGNLREPSCRWEDNIKLDLQKDWIDLAEGRDRWRALVNAVMNLGFHKMQRIS